MSVHIVAKQGRTCIFQVTLKDADGDNITIASGDKIRIKIGKLGETPQLDLVSGTNTVNGSSVTAANPTTVRLDQDDLDFTPGIYDIESGLVDASDSGSLLHADEGVFVLRDAQAGGVT
jgi:hypothetical protein